MRLRAHDRGSARPRPAGASQNGLAAPISLMSALTLASTVLVGLACAPEPRTPPFRISAYGPGLEISAPGHRVTLLTPDGVHAKWRVGRDSVRIFDDTMARIGQLRVAPDGWELTDLAGDVTCAVHIRNEAVTVGCGDSDPVSALVTTSGVHVALGDEVWREFAIDDVSRGPDGTLVGCTEEGCMRCTPDTALACDDTCPSVYELCGDTWEIRSDSGRLTPQASAVALGMYERPAAIDAHEWRLVHGALVWGVQRVTSPLNEVAAVSDSDESAVDPAEE